MTKSKKRSAVSGRRSPKKRKAKAAPVQSGEKSPAAASVTSHPSQAKAPVPKPKPIEVPREFTQPPKTVSEEGLVHMSEEKRTRLLRVPLHYCDGQWFGPNRRGGFSRYKDSQASALLSEYGFHRAVKNDAGTTECERALLWLMQNNHVGYAGPLAGWPTGAHQMGPDRVLVTEQLELVKPVAGKWDTVNALIQGLLDDPEHDQISVFYIWCASSVQNLYARMANPGKLPFQHCPALAIFGERGSGKSALLSIVLKGIFGERIGDPFGYLTEGRFNADLFSAALLMLDDKGASNNLEERRERADKLKALIWTESQRMEGKNTNAQVVEPWWRLVIGGNSETSSSLNILPTLNDSLRDKLTLLKARPAPGLPTDLESKTKWVAALRAELPAFVDWLLKFTVPKKLKGKLDPRTQVLNFWHPELESSLLEKQPECKALEVINELFAPGWEGSATEFYKEVRKRDQAGDFENLFNNIDKCGRLLSELSKSNADRVTKRMKDGLSRYTINKLVIKPEL